MKRGALLFEVTVLGHPRPKSRPRFSRGRVVSTASNHEKLWRAAVMRELFANRRAMIAAPVYVDLDFWFETTKADRVEQPHTHKPDKDNLEKLALDAMVKAGILKDDSLVASGETTKRWMMAGGLKIAVYAVTTSSL